MAVEDCDGRLQSAPVPKAGLKTKGRRPHAHNDDESEYVEERIKLYPKIHHETSPQAVIHPKGLPTLAAYPTREFDYAGQNRKGKDSQENAGYSRIITDPAKNQLGLSYHPVGDMSGMTRAEVKGAFIADYRRDTFKEEAEKEEEKRAAKAVPDTRSSTWPQQ